MLIELHFQARWIAASAIWGVVLSCWLMFSPQAHGTGICGRTQQVRDTIASTVGVDDCAAVTADHLKELVTLDLQNQAISTLILGDFDSLIRLQELKLSGNELSTLPPGLFNPLFSLRSLYLHDNDVASLPADLFDQLYLLDELTLHGNQLTELPEGMFDDLSRFQGVHLDQDVRGIDRLQQFIQSDDIATPEQFIEALPELHKQRFVFVYDSDGLNSEFVSGTHPRVISWGGDARFVFAWTTDPDASDQVRKSIEFLIPSGTEWSAGVIDFSGSAPEIDQPDECQSCHGSLNKPLWGTYDGWIGTETNLRGIDTDINSENMRNLAASTNERVSPLDFSGSDFSLGHYRRFFKPSQDLTVYMLAVEEIGMVLGLRHAQVLFQRLKSSEDYDEFAENTVCSNFPIDHAYNSFRPSSDQTIGVMLNKQQPIQSDNGISDAQFPDYQFRAEGGTLGEALVFLIVHDLWDSHAEVRQAYRSISNSDIPVPPNSLFNKQSYLVYPSGTATAEDELIQLYRLHFGHGNRSSLDTIDSVNPTELQFGNFTADLGAGHLSTMLPRVCLALRPDTTPPAVRKIEISSNPGSDRFYIVGDKIQATVTFSETVAVTGMPQLMLELGGSLRTATYQGGTGTADLVFAYEVAEEDSDAAGVGIGANQLGLNSGTIKDAAENDAVLDHQAVAANANHKVDGVKPALAATGGAVVDGTTLTLTYDESLDGSSTPVPGDFTVSGGDRARTVTGVRVNGSGVELTLDVGAEHGEAGIQVSYTPGDNPIRDVPGNAAEALSREPVTNDTPDTTAPTVESLAITSNPGSDQTYAEGDEIEVTVRFSETVVVTGTPQMRLRVGSRTRTAGYLSGTGTVEVVFGYEVDEGEEDTDGVSIEANRLSLNGGTIEDEAENAAVLDHETVAPQAGHQVDGVRPAFVSAAVDGASLTLTYGEALDEGSRPAPGDFTVQVDGTARSVSGVSVSGSVVILTLNPAVAHGDTGIRVSYTPDANPIRDAVGNDALGLSSRSVTNTTDAPNTAPQITSPSSFDVPENQAMVRRLVARDTDSGDEVTGWAIVGGADQGQFTITSDTGDLSFRTAPDFEGPGDNEYEVRVEVSSGAGARELEAEQTIAMRVTDEREPPKVPEAPTFSGETAESITVNWSEPDNTGPAITEYDVQYREKGTGRFIDGQHEGPGLSLMLDALEPGTVYEVQVRATNDEGRSNWSESGEGMTVMPLTVQMTSDIEPPVEGPFTVRFSFSEPVRGFSTSDIETGQDPACMDDQNTPVFCDPVIGGLGTIDDRIFTTTVTPVTDGVAHNYTLTITVPANTVTSVVDSKSNEETATLEVRIAPPGVTAPISTIGLRASPGNGRVTLRWNTPANTGGAPIVRYEYRWKESGGEFSDWISVGSGTRSATAPNLTNGAEYTFEARAVNALGKGSAETAVATPTLVTRPPPPPVTGGGGGGGGGGSRGRPPSYPGTIRAEGGDGAVTLTWNAPSSQGSSRIQHYEYRIDGEGEWISTGSTDRAHSITGLINGRTYFFHLRAVSAAGAGSHRISPDVTPVADLDFTHFANGGFITSTLALVNAGAYPVRPAIYFYDQDGDPIEARRVVELTPDLEVGDDGALSPRTVMNPLGELTIATHGRGGLRVGSVTVRAPGSIGGVLRFDIPGFGVAGVGDSPTLRDALVPVRRQEMGINTGVAVRNRGTATLTLQCRLMRDGAVIEEADIRLEANGQDSRFIDQVFATADTSDFAGSVRCAAPGPGRFSAVAFELDGVNRIFTTLPVVPVPAVQEQEQEEEQEQDATRLDFTHFANGGKIVSSLVLVNAGADPIRPAIHFHDQDGDPIVAESLVDITEDLEVGDDGALRPSAAINPLGELTISTHGRGGQVVGSAAVTADGPIGGVLRFDIPALGVAGVGDSPPVRGALVPVRRQDGGINTGVAVHNRGATALLVRCRLMRDGVVLEETMIPLAANGQDSRFIDQVFPGADTSDFAGSVRCMTPEPGLFSAVAFELDGVHRIFTTLPVVPVVEVP